MVLLLGLVACGAPSATTSSNARDQPTATVAGTAVVAPSPAAIASALPSALPSAAASSPAPAASSAPPSASDPPLPIATLPPPSAPPSVAPSAAPTATPTATVTLTTAPTALPPTATTAPSAAPRPSAALPIVPTVVSGLGVPPEMLPAGSKVKESRVVRFEHPSILYQMLVIVAGGERTTDAREEVRIYKGPGQSTPWTLWCRFPSDGQPARVVATVAALKGDATEQVLITALDPGTGGSLSYRLVGADNGKAIETRSPIYSPGEPNCCPSKVEVTTYAWDGKVFIIRRREQVPNQ